MTQQIIKLGTIPDDHTGSKLRTGGAMINANFTELYAAFLNQFKIGPVTGYKYPEFALGILQIYIVPETMGQYLFISKIISGVTTAGQREYCVEISLFSGLGSIMLVASGGISTYNYKSGISQFMVFPVNNSGVTAELVINWDILAHETLYTCASYLEGRIWSPITRSGDIVSGGGGLPMNFQVSITGGIIDGSQPIYIYKKVGEADIAVTLDSANNKGNVKILNMGGSNIEVSADSGLMIQGNSSIVIYPGEVINLGMISITDENKVQTTQFMVLNGVIHAVAVKV